MHRVQGPLFLPNINNDYYERMVINLISRYCTLLSREEAEKIRRKEAERKVKLQKIEKVFNWYKKAKRS